MWRVKDQYFREYYRSGNIFFYKLNAKFGLDDFQSILKSYANDGSYDNTEKIYNYPTPYDVKNSIPVQYTLLNPFYVVANRSTSWKQVIYQKVLSEYELERLQNPKNEHDKIIFESLDSEAQDKIKNGQWSQDGLKIQLNPTDVIYSFYKSKITNRLLFLLVLRF